jgi:hypothetical protein
MIDLKTRMGGDIGEARKRGYDLIT